MFEAFTAILVSRSAIEAFSDVTFGPLHLNIPALFGVALVLLASAVLLFGRHAGIHPISKAWAAWLLLLLPFVVMSRRNFGPDGLIAVREWIRLLSIAAVFALAYALPPRRGRARGLGLLFLALPIPLLAAAWQLVTKTGFVVGTERRLMGTLSHPNSFGIFLVLFIALTYERIRSSGHPLWTVLLFAEMTFLVGTLNMGGFAMLAVLLAWISIRETGGGRWLVLGIAVVFALILLTNRQAPAKLRYARSAAPAQITETVRTGSFQGSLGWRFANWRNLFEAWKARPFDGYGLHTTSFVNGWRTKEGVGFAAHNDFLRYLVETGALGLLVYLAFLLVCWVHIFRAARRAPPRRGAPLLWILAGVFLAWQAGSAADNLISTTAFQFLFWAALGFALRESASKPAPNGEGPPGVRRVTTVYPIDDRGAKIGGNETFLRRFIAAAPAGLELRVIGITARTGGLAPGRWHTISFEGRSVRFLPVLRVADPNRRSVVPLFFRFTAALAVAGSGLDTGKGLWIYHRIEPFWPLRATGGRKIFFLHGDPRHLDSAQCESRWRRIRRIYRRIERRLIPRFDRVFVVSRPSLEEMRRLYPGRADRFAFIPTSFDATLFEPRPWTGRTERFSAAGLPPEGKWALFVGRLEKAKDPGLLIEVFDRLARRRPDVRLAVAGCGSLEAGLKSRAAELGLSGRIRWLGPLPQAGIADLMRAADVLLLTSAFEAMPVAALEALACGLPVVAPDLGELRSLISGASEGRIVLSRDPDAIAAAAAEVLSAPRPEAAVSSRIAEYSSEAVFAQLWAGLDG